MYVQHNPARSGWEWLQTGLRHGQQRPGELFLLGNSYLFLVLLLGGLLPLIGPLLLIALGPTLNFGTMHIGQRLEQGHKVSPSLLFVALSKTYRQNLRPLLILSLIYAFLFEMASLICEAWVGQMPNMKNMSNPGQISAAQLQTLTDYALRYSLATALSTLPIVLMFWYAPVLLFWHQMQPAQALFSSMVAVWRNKAAFLTYGITWFIMSALVMGLPVILLRTAGLPPALIGAVQIMTMAVVMGVTIASFYASYVGVFAVQPERTNPVD